MAHRSTLIFLAAVAACVAAVASANVVADGPYCGNALGVNTVLVVSGNTFVWSIFNSPQTVSCFVTGQYTYTPDSGSSTTGAVTPISSSISSTCDFSLRVTSISFDGSGPSLKLTGTSALGAFSPSLTQSACDSAAIASSSGAYCAAPIGGGIGKQTVTIMPNNIFDWNVAFSNGNRCRIQGLYMVGSGGAVTNGVISSTCASDFTASSVTYDKSSQSITISGSSAGSPFTQAFATATCLAATIPSKTYCGRSEAVSTNVIVRVKGSQFEFGVLPDSSNNLTPCGAAGIYARGPGTPSPIQFSVDGSTCGSNLQISAVTYDPSTTSLTLSGSLNTLNLPSVVLSPSGCAAMSIATDMLMAAPIIADGSTTTEGYLGVRVRGPEVGIVSFDVSQGNSLSVCPSEMVVSYDAGTAASAITPLSYIIIPNSCQDGVLLNAISWNRTAPSLTFTATSGPDTYSLVATPSNVNQLPTAALTTYCGVVSATSGESFRMIIRLSGDAGFSFSVLPIDASSTAGFTLGCSAIGAFMILPSSGTVLFQVFSSSCPSGLQISAITYTTGQIQVSGYSSVSGASGSISTVLTPTQCAAAATGNPQINLQQTYSGMFMGTSATLTLNPSKGTFSWALAAFTDTSGIDVPPCSITGVYSVPSTVAATASTSAGTTVAFLSQLESTCPSALTVEKLVGSVAPSSSSTSQTASRKMSALSGTSTASSLSSVAVTGEFDGGAFSAQLQGSKGSGGGDDGGSDGGSNAVAIGAGVGSAVGLLAIVGIFCGVKKSTGGSGMLDSPMTSAA